MRKIIFTMIAVLLSTLSMSAQDDVYMSPQRDSVGQETQVESQRKLTRKEQKRLRKMRWLIPGCMVVVERKMTTSIKKGTPNEH